MIDKLYYWIYERLAKKDERAEYSSGLLQGIIRRKALDACLGMQGRLLEIGCATGLFLLKLADENPRLTCYGLDNDETRFQAVRSKVAERAFSNVTVVLGDAFDPPFEDRYFDAVICINFFLMLDSLQSVEKLLVSMKRVLKSGGKIIFEFRNSRNFFFVCKYALAKYYDKTISGQPLTCYAPDDIERALEKSGLTVVRKTFIGAFLFRSFAPVIMIEAKHAA